MTVTVTGIVFAASKHRSQPKSTSSLRKLNLRKHERCVDAAYTVKAGEVAYRRAVGKIINLDR